MFPYIRARPYDIKVCRLITVCVRACVSLGVCVREVGRGGGGGGLQRYKVNVSFKRNDSKRSSGQRTKTIYECNHGTVVSLKMTWVLRL